MVKTSVGAFALAALPSALAFRNTSPFFLFSTDKLNLDCGKDSSLAQSAQVTQEVFAALKSCPTKQYIIIDQAGVSLDDFADSTSSPTLSKHMRLGEDHIKTRYAIPDVVGQVDSKDIAAYLDKTCGYEAYVNTIKAPAASPATRQVDLLTADDLLADLIAKWASSENYTVIYTTSPPSDATLRQQTVEEHPPYEMEMPFGSEQMELKRDLSSHASKSKGNSTDDAGLFERYQYFTPGLFMGFAAIIPLFFILLVGIRALTSLEVSYFAFSKEMGPNAQKKQ